jgi:phenylalanyl-tRNA synthetase alpha subunit
MFVPQQHPAREMQDTFYVKCALDGPVQSSGAYADMQRRPNRLDPTRRTMSESKRRTKLEDTDR